MLSPAIAWSRVFLNISTPVTTVAVGFSCRPTRTSDAIWYEIVAHSQLSYTAIKWSLRPDLNW